MSNYGEYDRRGLQNARRTWEIIWNLIT